MFKNSKEKTVASLFLNLIDQSKPQFKDEVIDIINDHNIINEDDLYYLYDTMYGYYYESVDTIMSSAGKSTYSKFKLIMMMPEDALIGLDELLDSPFTYLPVWALYMVVCYCYTGKKANINNAQAISHAFYEMVQTVLCELDEELGEK